MTNSNDRLDHIHPELREFAAQFIPAIQLNASTLEAFRAGFGDIPLPDEQPVFRQSIPRTDGQPDVSVLVINAKAGTRRPGILHMHGGGFVLGAASASVPRMLPIALELDVTIVSVDYRLAPEANYAASISDNYIALEWMLANAAKLGIAPDRIAVMGDSAGGGHAALTAIEARNRGAIDIAFQALIYPMLDDRTGSTIMPPKPAGDVLWGATANQFGWASFLGMPPGGDDVPRSAVPARTDDLTGLPSTFLIVGDLDLFFAEGKQFAQRLSAANIPTEFLVIEGAFHGFDMVEDAAPTFQLKSALLSALRRGLGLN